VKRALLMAGLGLLGIAAIAVGTACLTSGCSTIGYYHQSVSGHLEMVRAARPVAEVMADPASDAVLRQRLELAQRIRDYAVRELKLPDNTSYRRYADLKRNAAVWNVVAAPELSLELERWCFPVVGCVAYRGYFDRDAAEAYAQPLRDRGLEVGVYGVPAYSTLGKLPFDALADPLLNTFIGWSEGELARIVFHELSHQVAYADGDTVFNESFATAVERIGARRWLETQSSAAARDEYAQLNARREDFRAYTRQVRDELDAVYRSERGDDAKRAAKAEVMARMRSGYEAMKRDRWAGFSGYDAWFARANNASFGVLSAYNEQVPQFEALFEREGRDFSRFYAEVRRLAALPRAERSAAMKPLNTKAE
jgi:predicted aminopeptidase